MGLPSRDPRGQRCADERYGSTDDDAGQTDPFRVHDGMLAEPDPTLPLQRRGHSVALSPCPHDAVLLGNLLHAAGRNAVALGNVLSRKLARLISTSYSLVAFMVSISHKIRSVKLGYLYESITH
jgi:hypothetical protein